MRPKNGLPWLDVTPQGTPRDPAKIAKITKTICSHVSNIINCPDLKKGITFMRYATIMSVYNATDSSNKRYSAYYRKNEAKGVILPFQINMCIESYVHTLRGRHVKGLLLALTTSLTNCPRWDPRYLAHLEVTMSKCRTFYICQRRSGKSTTAAALIAAKMITHPGDIPGYYCNDDFASSSFGRLVYNQAFHILSNRNLQTRLVMLYRCESLRNVTVNAVKSFKQITVAFGCPETPESILMCRSASKGGSNLRGHTHTTVILDEVFTMNNDALIALLPHATLEQVKQFGVCSPMPSAVDRICVLRNLLQHKPESEYNFFIFTNNCPMQQHKTFLENGYPCPCGKFYAPDHVNQNSSTDKDITDALTGQTSFFYNERGITSNTEDDNERAAIVEIVVDEANLKLSLDRNQSLAKWIPHMQSHAAGPIITPYNCIFSSTYINSLYFDELGLPRVPEIHVENCVIYVDPALGSDNWLNTSAIGIACVGLDASRVGKHAVLVAAEHYPVSANVLGRVHEHIANLVINIVETHERKRHIQHQYMRLRTPLVQAKYRVICEKNSSVNAVHQVVECLIASLKNTRLAESVLVYHSSDPSSAGSSTVMSAQQTITNNLMMMKGHCGKRSAMAMGGLNKRVRLADGTMHAGSVVNTIPIGYILGKSKKPMFVKLATDLHRGTADLTFALATVASSPSLSQARSNTSESISTICAKFMSLMSLQKNGTVSGKCPITTAATNTTSTVGINYNTDDLTVALVMAVYFAINPPEATSYRSLLQLSVGNFVRS